MADHPSREQTADALVINGRLYEPPDDLVKPLAYVLRDDLGLTGTKVGCAEGRCGACTVLVDGRAVFSCLYPAGLALGQKVTTVEGLAGEGALTPLQEQILDRGGVQCGICTPGILMTLTALLTDNPHPDERNVRAALEGNICRCTGYQAIVEAALAVAESTNA